MNKCTDKSIEKAKSLVAEHFTGNPMSMRMARNECSYFYERTVPKALEDNLVEIEGTLSGSNKDEGMYLIVNGGKVYKLAVVKDSFFSSLVREKPVVGDEWYSIAITTEEESVYVPVVVIKKSEKERFMSIKSLYGRSFAIKSFDRLVLGKKLTISSRLQAKTYSRADSADISIFTTREDQMLLYAMTKETFTPEAQRTIEEMFRDSASSKHKVEQRLRYLFGFSSTYEKRRPMDIKTFGEILDERFYKMERPKKLIKDVFAAIERSDKKGCNLLFVGPPGVGKTSLMTAISESMNMPYESIPMNGLSCPLEIEGLDPGYDSADAGAIVRAFYNHGTSQMVICLDEFDKMNRNSKEGDPMNVFLRTFLGEHNDKFLQCTVNTDNTVFIATANSVDDIPEAILNRFNAVIYLDEYTTEDKLVIAKKYIVPEVLKNCKIDEGKVSFTDEALVCIIENYCEDDGARDLKHNVERMVNRIVSLNKADDCFEITPVFVDQVLKELVEETPGLYFRRNRKYYSETVAAEIKKCLLASKKTISGDPDRFSTEKQKSKLDYFLACRSEAGTFLEGFNPDSFREQLHKDVFGMEKVIEEITDFYYTAFLQGENLNSNLALCGGYGIGKTTIVKSIARAMGYNYAEISLNGIGDLREIRGFSSTYIGSEPGCIIKGVKKAGSKRTVFKLDEIDKMKPEFAVALLDLLDREFTDTFLGVPVDFKDSIFIATANDWGNVPAVIRDRFIVVDVDGYSRSEKSQILNDYIIPRLERGYAASGVSISIDEEAEKYLLTTYANSFGVRDAEKAMQRICAKKLVDQAGTESAMQVFINKEDVNNYLGVEPIPRGNFPDSGCVPGVSKALAVSNGSTGSTFAIETVLIDGNESLEMTGLPKESATDSVKIAVTCIKKMFPELLKNKQIHVHFGEGSVPKDGPSAGVALYMSILSAALDKPIMDKVPYDIAYTGEIGLTGGVFAIGGTYEKLQAASDSGCSKVFIPKQNYDRLDMEKLSDLNCKVIPVSHISEVVNEVFPNM